MAEWMPGTDQGKLQTLGVFSRGVAGRPEVFGVAPDTAAEALRLVEAFEASAQAASNPATRTTVVTAAKRDALDAAVKYCRRLASFIRLNPSISETDLAAIGLPPKAEKRRVPPPTTAPILAICGIIPGGHEIEMFDSATPDRRALAKDTKGLELFVAYSPNNGNGSGLEMEGMIRNAKPHAILKRGLSRVLHPNERVGSVANYIGRWINGRGEAGPWSQPVRMVLAMPGEGKLSDAA